MCTCTVHVACLGLNCAILLIKTIPLLILSDSSSLMSSCPCLFHHYHCTHAYIIIIFFLAYPFSQPQPSS